MYTNRKRMYGKERKASKGKGGNDCLLTFYDFIRKLKPAF
ncbi:hypothetical protein TPE_2284 [Treponema pedis str. T A4]|uniref:Uncharacterized protein n=1 Tax=Treponema pedis str. T A4 TaxID=1291379 RepID=S6A1K5_9SPIR|nr:hypothetical protein TPE_2284 [Treponema pedis str. T A4]